MTTTIQTTQFPVYYDGHEFTSIEVHDGPALGLLTLRRNEADRGVTVAAGDVKRNLYSVRTSFTDSLITGSYGQPLVVTWEQAEAMVERFTALVGRTAPKGTVYSIEVAA